MHRSTTNYGRGFWYRRLSLLLMSVQAAARSVASIVLLILGVILLVFAVIDFLAGFGLIFALVLIILGILFLALSSRV